MTPLLSLFEGILSRDETRIQDALQEISSILMRTRRHNCPELRSWQESSQQSTLELWRIVQYLLTVCPEQAWTPSSHDGSLPLHIAASMSDVGIVRVLLLQYPSAATIPNKKGKIPLHYAARVGQLDMVRLFLQHVPQTASIATTKRKLALHFAAGEGHVDIVKALLAVYPQGASQSSSKGKLPLHFAARWGHREVAQELLHVYPEGLHALDYEGLLPLHEAAREGQYNMARFLVDRFPLALATASMRGELPLFLAVRSGNRDLIWFFLQAWPMAGRHVLQNVADHDNVSNWPDDILELLLRGAVDNFTGCTILPEHPVQPPACRLNCDLSIVAAYDCPNVEDEEDGNIAVEQESTKKRKVESKAGSVAAIIDPTTTNSTQMCHSSREEFVIPTTTVNQIRYSKTGCTCCAVKNDHNTTHTDDFDSIRSQFLSSIFYTDVRLKGTTATACHIPKSVSPLPFVTDGTVYLEQRKRKSLEVEVAVRPEGVAIIENDSRSGGIIQCCCCCDCHVRSVEPRTFLPLHAALESSVSRYVLRRILETGNPDDLQKKDDLGRLPLHLALSMVGRAHRGKDQDLLVDLVLNQILCSYPKAALARDGVHNRLPLHVAIENQVDFRIIGELLEIHPSSAIEPCDTNDEWKAELPIQMACHYGCDLGTVYRLLRLEPSFVEIKRREVLGRTH